MIAPLQPLGDGLEKVDSLPVSFVILFSIGIADKPLDIRARKFPTIVWIVVSESK